MGMKEAVEQRRQEPRGAKELQQCFMNRIESAIDGGVLKPEAFRNIREEDINGIEIEYNLGLTWRKVHKGRVMDQTRPVRDRGQLLAVMNEALRDSREVLLTPNAGYASLVIARAPR